MNWIDVKNKSPKELETVLVCTDLGYVFQGFKVNSLWREVCTGNEFGNVTHWMPLPEPPQNTAQADEYGHTKK